MEKAKEIFGLIFGSRLIMESNSRDMLKMPIWLLVILAFDKFSLVAIAGVIAIAFGMQFRVEKG